jgi:hypothetical protein
MNYGAILMIALSIGFGVLIFLAGRWITNWFFRINKIVTELEAIHWYMAHDYKTRKKQQTNDDTGKL